MRWISPVSADEDFSEKIFLTEAIDKCSDCPLKKEVIEGLKMIAAGKRKIEEALK